MKGKKFFTAAAILCAVTAFGGCSARGGAKDYDGLNAKLDRHYSQVVLRVTDTFGEEDVLVSEYTMTFSESGTTVKYSVERFAEASIDFAVREKTTLTGEAIVSGGEVAYVSGSKVGLDALTTGDGLNFKKEYFENDEWTKSSLKADVKDPAGFSGAQLNCTQMSVEASFSEVFQNIKVVYTAENGNRVECLYTFSL